MNGNDENRKKENKRALRLLKIFEAYDLCSADALGRLVREEMLVALGIQNDVDWEIVGDNSLKDRRAKVHELEAYKEYFG